MTSFFNVDKLLFYIKQLDDFQKMTFIFTHLRRRKLSVVRKVPETLLIQALGIIESKTVWGTVFSLSQEIKERRDSIISHGTSTKFAGRPYSPKESFLITLFSICKEVFDLFFSVNFLQTCKRIVMKCYLTDIFLHAFYFIIEE